MTMPEPAPSFVLVGWGYRSRAWWEAARGIGATCAGIVVRSPRETPVPSFGSIAEAVATTGARFVVSSVGWTSAAAVIAESVHLGLPILSETPPAADLEGLATLWSQVGDSGLVQVAEQYPQYPSHAARLALVRSGALGTPTQVQVSSTQLYHAVALMRAHLDARPGTATVTATTTSAPLLQPLSRAGWTPDPSPTSATTTHAVIQFGAPGEGRSGVYDFTDLQTRNLLRVRRLVVRGTHGELDGEQVLRWGGPETVLSSRIERRQSGHDLDMSGYDSEALSHGDHVLWRNPWPGRRWSDDEHATAAVLAQMATWVSDSEAGSSTPGPYPLAEACQDAAIGFAIEESVRRGAPVTLPDQPWW
ncbi:hypothetical protein [Aestuariimicrobium kwangyangense]|uniref:hypothetical protein n=1 Tax=Aestuariimicrobium kwangyangense TaxID=396389 RepID=UPI0003B3AB77|nr:hypothetical protein [Aestuariimicrobium kwangyangense]